MVQNAKRIVFFGGAGVSTESGIPDFRSEDGLYHLKYPYPRKKFSAITFYGTYKRILSFYKEKVLWLDVKPNITHSNWRSGKKRENYPVLLRKILMDFTNWQEVNVYWSCMALFTGTIV